MNAITPPKLIPPFQSTAASGMLPTEQTNESTAMSGPTTGPHTIAHVGCDVRNTRGHQSIGTHAASAPAISSPPTTSFHTDTQSITK